MPWAEHAVFVEILRSNPAVVATLLRAAGVRVPRAVSVAIAESTFLVAVPDLHADLALVLRGSDGEERLVVLFEVQLDVDRYKPHRWLLYQAAAQDRHRCEVVVLVFTPDARVARWAARPHRVGPRGNYAPLVLGPRSVPRIRSVPASERTPQLVILSALALGKGVGPEELRAVAEALTLSMKRTRACTLISSILGLGKLFSVPWRV